MKYSSLPADAETSSGYSILFGQHTRDNVYSLSHLTFYLMIFNNFLLRKLHRLVPENRTYFNGKKINATFYSWVQEF